MHPENKQESLWRTQAFSGFELFDSDRSMQMRGSGQCRFVPLMWHGYYKMDSLYRLLKA